MKREEAIGIWLPMVLLAVNESPQCVEAVKMAGRALAQKPCEDAISRDAAIKAMDDLEKEDIELYGCSIPEGFDGKRAIEALQKLPSVTAKQKARFHR